MDRGDAKKMMM